MAVAICGFVALGMMRIGLFSDAGLSRVSPQPVRRLKALVAAYAYSQRRAVGVMFSDPQLAACHDLSLAQTAREGKPYGFCRR